MEFEDGEVFALDFLRGLGMRGRGALGGCYLLKGLGIWFLSFVLRIIMGLSAMSLMRGCEVLSPRFRGCIH